MKQIVIRTTPKAKPRMTQRDKWAKRKCVVEYYKYCDILKSATQDVTIDWDGISICFNLPMPKSWSKKKKTELAYTLHRQKPDIDNLLKAVLDALLPDDSHVAYIARLQKSWAPGNNIGVFLY